MSKLEVGAQGPQQQIPAPEGRRAASGLNRPAGPEEGCKGAGAVSGGTQQRGRASP